MVSGFFFDLDGTLTDPAEGITHSVAYALTHFGIQTPDLRSLHRYIGPPLIDAFMEYEGFTAAQANEAVRQFRVYFKDRGIFENRVYEGIGAMLAALRGMGARLYVATSKPEEFARQILDRFELSQYFHGIAGATMDEKRTKKSEVIGYLLDRFGLRGQEETYLMVGDRRHDFEGAAACGLRSVGVLYGYGSREELTAAGAWQIAESVEDLSVMLQSLLSGNETKKTEERKI